MLVCLKGSPVKGLTCPFSSFFLSSLPFSALFYLFFSPSVLSVYIFNYYLFECHSSSFSFPCLQTCCPPIDHQFLAVITASSFLPLSSWMSTVTAFSWEGKMSCTLSCWDPPAVSRKR